MKNLEMTECSSLDIDPLFKSGLFRNTRKMTALFEIDRVKHVGTDVVNNNSAWVFSEPARATVKRDGTGVVVTADGEILVRRSVKKGKRVPEGFRLAEVDAFTGHMFGVEPVAQSGFKAMMEEALLNTVAPLEQGTFELCGPKINGNPEGFDKHVLIRHGAEVLPCIPDMRTVVPGDAFGLLKELFEDLKTQGVEGVVWWGTNDKRVKLRVKDFFGDDNRW
jgi:hypothetical protein